MWRMASRVTAGITMAVAVVVLVMIVRMADDPVAGILVPPPGEVGSFVPPTSFVDVVAAQPAGRAESVSAPAGPAGTLPPQQTVTSPKPVTRQQTPTTRPPAAGGTVPVADTSAAKPPVPAPDLGPVIVCPAVAGALPAVPPGAQSDVNRELRLLDSILAEANRRLREAQNIPDPGFVQNAIVGPLVNQRIASLDRITIAIGRFGPRPSGLARLAPCTVR